MQDSSYGFQIGRVYNRKRDIHGKFGGQQQGGISTPARHPVIILFTGETGEQYGYSDGFNADGTFLYTGEGQYGDMEFVRGNKAIRDHAENGKDILLFEAAHRGHCRFLGFYDCADYSFRQSTDLEGDLRKAIVFHLVPREGDEGPTAGEAPATDIDTLRQRAFEAATPTVKENSKQAPATYYSRSQAVKDYVLARAAGCCELCGEEAPFKRPDGSPYLEVHHIRRLTDGGPDDPRHMAGLCPSCHRLCHYGEGKIAANKKLASHVKRLEADS